MHMKNLVGGLVLALSVSTFMVGCSDREDTQDRAALERESLERELELALQPDTTQQPELNDVPFEEIEEEPEQPPAAAPAPAPRQPAPRPSPPARQDPPRQTAPAPAPSPAPSAPRRVAYTVPSGSTFSVRINEQLSTRSHSVGSTFTATLTEPILAPDGTTLIPTGATVRGQVTESREAGRAGQEPSLHIAFTSITYGGETYPISGSTGNPPVRLVTRDGRGEQAAKVGGGAAVGAVLGQIIGRNTRSTVAGAAIGAAAGTAVAIGTADVDAVVDEGSSVRIRLDRSVTIER